MGKKRKNNINVEEFENLEEQEYVENEENIANENVEDFELETEENIEAEEEKEEENHQEEKDNSQNIDYFSLAQKVQAEFDNYRKRTNESEKNAYEKGFNDAIIKILPIMDGLHSAEKNLKEEENELLEPFRKQMQTVLKDMEVEKIDVVGKEFNPNYQNALFTGCEEDKEDNIVLEELQEGFMRKDKVLRYSLVKINKK